MPPRFKVSPKAERTLDGITFDSKKEMMRYAELKLLQRAGEIEGLTCQPSYTLEIGGKPFCKYTADFSYIQRNVFVIEDVKSTGTVKDSAYKLRKKAFELSMGLKVTEVIR